MDGTLSLFCNIVVVGNQDNGVALLMQLVKDIDDFPAGLGIQRTGWFVSENQLGIGNDGSADIIVIYFAYKRWIVSGVNFTGTVYEYC